MMMYQMCFTFGRAESDDVFAFATFVAAVAVATDETPKTSDPATTTERATREPLLVALEIERIEFMNFVMQQPNSGSVEFELHLGKQ